MRRLVRLAKTLPPPLRRVAAALSALPARASFALIAPYFRIRRRTRRKDLPGSAYDKQSLTLFLAPEAGLTQYFVGHALLAKTLAKSGHKVAFMSCAGSLAMCSLKSVIGFPNFKRGQVCSGCRRATLKLAEKYDLPDIAIESVISKAEAATIQSLIAKAADQPWTLCHDGIAFGEFALGETLRNRRKLEIADLDGDDLAQLSATVTAGLQNYFAVRNILAQYDVDRLVYYGAYAYWLPVVMLARKMGVPTTQIEHGYNRDIDMRLLNLRPVPVHEQQLRQASQWGAYRDIPLEPETALSVAESGLYRLSNHGQRSTHSPNFVRRDVSILEDFGLSPARKTLIAYSSSADEFLAACHILRASGLPYGDGVRPFADSNAWLKGLVDWVGTQDDLQLIVRLHPRLSAPQGQKPAAEEIALRALLSELPDNVRIVWPRDKVSSYNLAEAADVALVSWSTIGLELARFGIPVIASFPDRGPFPVGTFIGFEETPEQYFSAIRKALASPASYEMIAEAIRWTHFLFLSPTVDLSDIIPQHVFRGVPDWVMPSSKERIIRSLVHGEDTSQMRMEALPRSAQASAAEGEALRRAIERTIILFMTGHDTTDDRITEIRTQPGNIVALTYNGRVYRHISPLAYRLAVLWNEAAAVSQVSMAGV